jgi:hypothetical protein
LQINKTENFTSGKNAAEPISKKETTAKTTSIKPFVSISTSRSVMSLINNLKLPSDKLSASIISFTRFFSLPLKAEQLAEIRRQAFTPARTSETDVKQAIAKNSAAELAADKNRAALSLSAAAAESKGVELQPKALVSFAEAVDPEWQRRQDGQKREQRDKNREQKDESSLSKTGVVSSSNLEKLALESAEKNPLLYLLNRMPGKNGQRWIVLPFDFSQDGKDFRVSMRILLETKQANRAVLMALDIAETTNADNRWLFALESANNQPARLSVFISPDLPRKVHSSIKSELSLLLGIPAQSVSVKERLDDFPCESADELLRSVDEAV